MKPARPKSLRYWLRQASQTLLLIFAVMWLFDWWRAPVLPADADQTLHTIDGRALNPAELSRQEPVVLYFWGSWCGICRHTSPAIEQLRQDGVRVLSIATASGSEADIAGYLKQHGWQFPAVADPQGRLAAAWQIKAFPTIVILRHGKIRHSTSGISSYYGLKARLAWAAW